jgi:hypothetical protein
VTGGSASFHRDRPADDVFAFVADGTQSIDGLDMMRRIGARCDTG